MKGHKQGYRESLIFCSRVAQEECEVSERALAEARSTLRELTGRTKEIQRQMRSNGGAVGDAKGKIGEIAQQLEQGLSQSLEKAEDGLARKRKRLDKFTVTLFGRTMAGKSTIREALTRGDGSTIGRGAQRTTQDIREYEWDHLRIIDTPGIGAYQGEADRDLALSVIDQSDVVLFLASSDGIQETSFEGMRALRDQNKPVIFVLNVKRDLTKRVYLKRFLRDPGGFLGRDQVQGHIERIRHLAESKLGMRRVTVVAIHAQAAYLATRPEHRDVAEALTRASRIGELLGELRREVQFRGPVRRVQTVLDGTTNALIDLQDEYHALGTNLRQSATYLQDKFFELDAWLDAYIPAANQRFEDGACRKLASLRRGISTFVEENIESSNFGRKWKNKVKALNLEGWMAEQQQRTTDEIMARLQQFQDEMDLESSLLDGLDTGSAKSYDPWAVKRTLRWVSAGGGAVASVAAVALMLGGANFWNPVGWVAGGIGIIALGLSWFFDSREKKLQKQKAETSKRLRDQVDKIERQLSGQLKKWFYDQFTSKLIRGIRSDTRALRDGVYDLARELHRAARRCDAIVAEQNARLVVRIASFQRFKVDQESIHRVVRDPGLRTKLRWVDQGPGRPIGRAVGQAIGEWIDEVHSGTVEEMVAQALSPAKAEDWMVDIDERRAEVTLPANEMGKAIGRRGSNVRLASRLMQMKINIREIR